MIRLTTAKWRLLAIMFIIARLTVPLLIFIQPFWITIIAWVLDIFDNPVWLNSRVVSPVTYQILDKLIDTYTLAIYWAASLTWNIPLLTVLFLWRFVGVFVVLFSRHRGIFILFPNVFEHMFQIYAFGMFVDPSVMPFINDNIALLFVVVLIVKLYFEYDIHYNQRIDSMWVRWDIMHKNYRINLSQNIFSPK